MAEDTLADAMRDYYLDSASGAFVADKTFSTYQDVARILDLAASNRPVNGLVIHFHGGLVARNYALANIVPPLSRTYLNANAYPLFFVWESGLKEALVNNKAELLQDPTFRELVKKVTEWTLRKTSSMATVMVRGEGDKPVADLNRFRQQYDEYFNGDRAYPPVPDADRAVANAIPPVTRAVVVDETELALAIEQGIDPGPGFDPAFSEAIGQAYNASVSPTEVASKGAATGTSKRAARVLLDEAALEEMFPSPPGAVRTRGVFTWAAVAKFVAKLVIAVIKRYRDGRDHGVYCTVVEEVLRGAFLDLLGSNIWNQMKNDTLDSFAPGEYCGTAVVAKLKELQGSGNGFKKLTLVGHSTGAIYICNFLDAAKAAGLTFNDVQIVFLAPAVTCSRFAKTIRDHGTQYLQNFRMFAMHDERESGDVLVPVLYTRSLLYFVSGLLEGIPSGNGWTGQPDMPLVGMERFFAAAHHQTFANESDVQTVLHFLTSAPSRTVWSQSLDAGPGLNSDSSKHGDFDNDPATLESVAQIIAP